MAVGGQFFLNDRILTSPDGGTWTDRSVGASNQFNAVDASPTLIVAVGEDNIIYTSANNIN